MKKTFAILVMTLCGCCGMAQIDTVRYGDSCWLFNNTQATHRLYPNDMFYMNDTLTDDGFLSNISSTHNVPHQLSACSWDLIPTGIYPMTLLQEFVLEEPTDLYGIAITMGLREKLVHDPISAVLYHKNEAGQMQRLDSVPWNPSWHLPHARFEYVAAFDLECYRNTSWWNDTVRTYAPVYKYYFDTPHYGLIDTIYVGFYFDYDSARSLGEFHSQVMYGEYVWDPLVSDENNPYFMNQTCWMLRIYDGAWLYHSGDSVNEAYQWDHAYSFIDNNLRFLADGVFPIVEPKVVDTIPACEVPDSLHIMMQNGDYLILEWAEAPHSLGYQLSYGDFRNDPDSNHIESLAVNRKAFRIDTGIYYAARVRSQCSHSCPVHDTLVWSDWSEPVFFYAGTMPDTATVGIAEVERLSVLISPNPTSGRVNIRASEPMRQVAVYDMAGKEVFEAESVVPKPEWDLDLSSLPSGSYIVKVTTKSLTTTRKLIVE